MSDKKPKKPSKPPSKHLVLGIATNVATSPLGFRAELDINPKSEQSHPWYNYYGAERLCPR